MTRKELAAAMVESADLTKTASANVVDGAVAAIEAALKKGEKVSLVGFGTFRTVQRKARQGRNPRTGVPLKIKARRVVAFRPGALLARAVK